jgi:uncharacterized protein (DUF1697 family)
VRLAPGPCIVFLRGLNVGRSRRIGMDAVRAALEEAGFREVRTYLQSGNAVALPPPGPDHHALAASIETRLTRVVGSDVGVLVLTPVELAACIAANPFPDAASEPRTLHAFFLNDRPSEDAVRRLADLARDGERVAVSGRVLYLHAPAGIGRSRLAGNVERSLGVAATARNWRTVTTVLALAAGSFEGASG